jgi:DNA-binding CsgD family transcriptional regulator
MILRSCGNAAAELPDNFFLAESASFVRFRRVGMHQPPPLVPDATFELWQRLSAFPASETGAALHFLQEWIAREIDADNVIWIGGVRVLHGVAAEADAFLGWRLRDRVALRPDPEPYRERLAEYFDKEHYGKLTSTYYERSHEAQKEDHVGMDSRASMAGCGRFRIGHIRDPEYLDFEAFQKTSHYQRYYRDGGIADRFMVGYPVTDDHESLWMVDRFQSTGRPPFTTSETRRIGDALRGLGLFHRYLLLSNGLLMADKLLSGLERQILQGLLNGLSEKEIALFTDQKVTTLHKYVTRLYTLYGVKSRPALMALWLGGR